MVVLLFAFLFCNVPSEVAMIFGILSYRFEKMVAFTYLGELARLAMQALIKAKEKPLFSGKSSTDFDEFMNFDSEDDLCLIESG